MEGAQPAPHAGAGHLFGREPDVARLRTFLRDVAVNGGALLLVGDPGIGKSVLLDVAATEAAGAGSLILRATGLEFLSHLSYSTLHHLLNPLRARLAELDPVHREAVTVALGLDSIGASDRLVVYNAVLALLRRAALDRPVLLAIDDLHWVDRATAELLGFVARRLTGTRVGLLAAVQPGVEGFFPRSGLPEHTMPPLAEADAAALIGARFPMLGGRTARRVLTEAQGNPLALLELPLALTAAQREASQALPTTLPLSRRLHALFGARVAHLPSPTRHLLLLAALDATGDLRIPLQAAGGRADLADLAPAEHAALVTVDHRGRRLAFRHPLVRSTVVESSAVPDRLAAHRALAEVLTAEPERRLWHLAEATTGPDEQVAEQLERAARVVLRRGDAVGAFTALLRSADLSPAGSARSARLAEAAYVGADVAGELRTAARLLVEARRADPTLRQSLRAAVAASSLLLNSDGDINTAHRLLVGAIRAAAQGAEGDEQALSEALHTLLDLCLYGARDELWPAFHDAMGRLTSPPPSALHLLVAVLAEYAHLTPADVAMLDTEIEGLAGETDPRRIERIARAALFLDRAGGCREALWRIIDDGRNGGAVTSAIVGLMLLAMEDFASGQWDEAARLTAEGLSLSARHGYLLLCWPFHFQQALLAAVRGDDDAVHRLVSEMDAWAAPRQARMVEHYARHAAALAALGRGDAERAYREATAIGPAGVLPYGVPVAQWMGMDLVEAAVRTGRSAEATAHVVAMRHAGLPGLSPRLAMLTTVSAALAAPDGEAAELFEQALAVPGGERWPFSFARVHLVYGEHLRRTRGGTATRSRSHLAAALAIFHRLGAEPWAARAAAELRAAGEGVPGSHADVAHRVTLTPQEREIAMLAASGLTNKQIGERLFMSHRTVGSHLHRIFPRLGITSRTALRDALSALAADDGEPNPRR